MEFTKPRKIFIVDDNVIFTKALSQYLTLKVPHQVSIFNTGEECLKRISENPDVVILDFNLNTVQKDAANGLEILETIKKHYPDIHIIMLSSQESYAKALQSIQKGAEQYVIKDEHAFENTADMIQELV
jgi:two-component system, OmpR family, response regulator